MHSIVVFNGGLGNQLFQYVFMVYLQEIMRYDVQYNLSKYSFRQDHAGFQADKIFRMDHFTRNTQTFFTPLYRGIRKIEQALGKTVRPSTCLDGAFSADHQRWMYEGFWQNICFYDTVKDIVKANRLDLSQYCGDSRLVDNVCDGESVFVHVRRGDYCVDSKYADISSTDYYRQAIAIMERTIKNPKFFVFSDDIQWSKHYFKERTDFQYVQYPEQTAIGDLFLMQTCKHAMIANSSFSWWGAALDTKGVVTYPAAYYADGKSENVYAKDWIKVEG